MESNQRDMFSAVDGMRSTLAKREAEQAERQRQQAEDNRRAMPTVAAWIDATRKAFPDAKVAYASEGGRTVGERSPAGIRLSETVVGGFARRKK